MSFEKYTALTQDIILAEFKVSKEEGLSKKDILSLQQKYGRNELSKNEISALKIFIRQFKSAFIYVLFGASLVTFLLQQYVDSIFIILFVLINVVLGFIQEYKSEQTSKYLHKFTNQRATVIRDGEEKTIDASELVPGDILIIETGDIVPADTRLITVQNLVIDESTLTGESIEVRKQPLEFGSEQKGLYKATNIAFSGTTVVEGKALGIVVATGKNSQIGKIAKLATEERDPSAFEKQIGKFSKFTLILTVVTLILVFIVHIFFKDTFTLIDLTIFSVALAVGVIPEAMPLVTTFSLSIGANKLAKKKVIVKRLSAIKDLGGIQVLCTDKTGTITENKLTVNEILSDNSEKTLLYALAGASSLDSKGTPNNAFDLAILSKTTQKQRDSIKNVKRIFEIPFNPSRRRNSVLVELEKDKRLIVRGAAESILPYVINVTEKRSQEIEKWISIEGIRGNRVIAVAAKIFKNESYKIKDEEEDLHLLGLISFVDPIKRSTVPAVKKAKDLGVIVKIITGDSPDVAGAVGTAIGICENVREVITGDKFEKLSDEEKVTASNKYNVFARMSPEQKYNLIKILQNTHEVGYLGEGINDAPALKASGVSIVVEGASDVSREVADIILLKHDLQVIVDGIELGRKTFVNVTNYIKATLAANFGNFYAMVFVTLIIDYLPMLPIQILLVNLLSDFPMISIATDSVDKKDIKTPKSYSVKELVLGATILGLVSSSFDFVTFGIFKGDGPSSLQTYWFLSSILTELVLIYSIRTREWFFKVKNIPSKTIIILTAVAAVVTVALPFTNLGINAFHFITPAFDKLLIVLAIVVGYLISTEIVKRFYYKYLENGKLL